MQLRNILLIVTYFISSDSSIAAYCKTYALTCNIKVVPNREESVLGYINFMYHDKSMARCSN